MSFLTRKPENTAGTAAPASGAVPATASEAGGKSSGKKEPSLAELYQALADSQKQITDYLLAREATVASGGAGVCAGTVSPGGTGSVGGDIRALMEPVNCVLERLNMLGQYVDGQMMPAIAGRFDALEALLKNLPAVATTGGAGASASSAGENTDGVTSQAESTTESSTVTQEIENVQVSQSAPSMQSMAPPRSVRGGSEMAQLDKAFFGEMALEPSIQNERQYILQGILAHDATCCYLGGVLMMFQSSSPEKMVLLLKDLGEAYYRWANSFPDMNFEQIEDVLARWAQWLCESAGLPNRIEIVHPGQRFDSARHNSVSRGVAVTQVHGWVVLRGNGSVYSKALVDVQ